MSTFEELCPNAGKSSWPELIGVPGDVAAEVVAHENPKVRVIVLKEGSIILADFRCDRVRVWIDKSGSGMVTRAPHIG